MEYIIIVAVCIILAFLLFVCIKKIGIISFIASAISSVFAGIFYKIAGIFSKNQDDYDGLVDNKTLSRDMGKAQVLYDDCAYAESESILLKYIYIPECCDYAAELLAGCYYHQGRYGSLITLMFKFPAMLVYWLSAIVLSLSSVAVLLYVAVYGAGMLTIAHRNYDIDKENAAFASIVEDINNTNSSFYYDVANLNPLDLYVDPDSYAMKIKKLLDTVQEADEKSNKFAEAYSYLQKVNTKLDEKITMPEKIKKYVTEYSKIHVSTVNHNYDSAFNDTLNYMKSMKLSHEAAIVENNNKIDAEKNNLNMHLKAEEERKEFERQQAIRQEEERQAAELRRIEEENRRIEEEERKRIEEENRRIQEENKRMEEQMRQNRNNNSGNANIIIE